jgi:hypothetical protein
MPEPAAPAGFALLQRLVAFLSLRAFAARGSQVLIYEPAVRVAALACRCGSHFEASDYVVTSSEWISKRCCCGSGGRG